MAISRIARWPGACLALLVTVLALAPGPVQAWWWSDHSSEEAAKLAAVLDVKPGATVAEIGAGKGQMTVAMAQWLGASGRVFSTEIDPDRLADIEHAVQAAHLDNVTVLRAAVDSTNLPPQCCDAIFMRGVYHHFTAPAEIDRSLFEALRPGGRLAVIDFPPTIWLWPWTPKGIPENRGGHGVPPEILTQELTAAGFRRANIQDWPISWLIPHYCAVFEHPGH